MKPNTNLYLVLILVVLAGTGCDSDNTTEPENNPPVITSLTAMPMTKVETVTKALLTEQF